MTIETAQASARKSYGEYKPVVRLPGGRTRVTEQSLVSKRSRGTLYATRPEAVAAAQRYIDAARADAEARLAKYLAQGRTGRGIACLRAEVAMWGGLS